MVMQGCHGTWSTIALCILFNGYWKSLCMMLLGYDIVPWIVALLIFFPRLMYYRCYLSSLFILIWLDDSNQVLHMDRNDYYGGESSSLSLNQVLVSNYSIESKLILHPFDVATELCVWSSFYYNRSHIWKLLISDRS